VFRQLDVVDTQGARGAVEAELDDGFAGAGGDGDAVAGGGPVGGGVFPGADDCVADGESFGVEEVDDQ